MISLTPFLYLGHEDTTHPAEGQGRVRGVLSPNLLTDGVSENVVKLFFSREPTRCMGYPDQLAKTPPI